MALALAASLISIWTGVSVALIEILVGVVAGNFLGLHANTEWINFLAMLGSGVLTFLAGAEIDPHSLKANLRASALIGVISFAAPFALVWAFAQFVLVVPLPPGRRRRRARSPDERSGRGARGGARAAPACAPCNRRGCSHTDSAARTGMRPAGRRDPAAGRESR